MQVLEDAVKRTWYIRLRCAEAVLRQCCDALAKETARCRSQSIDPITDVATQTAKFRRHFAEVEVLRISDIIVQKFGNECLEIYAREKGAA